MKKSNEVDFLGDYSLKTSPGIYVGTYHKYASGSLKGKWFYLSDYSSKEEFIEDCLKFHQDENDPELMFQDWESVPKSFISESFIDPQFWDYLQVIPKDEKEPLDIYIDNIHGSDLGNNNIEEIYSDFLESYAGDYSSCINPQLDFATELFDELYSCEVAESIRYYIDYKSFAYDLFISDYWEEQGFIFRNQ